MKRIGVLGGTFDPIHIGHLIAASEAHAQLELDKVLFIPAGLPWQKSNQIISAPENRVEMVRIAISGDDRFELSEIEINRTGPSYAIETFEQLHDAEPETEFIWILGADAASKIETWHRWQDFLVTVPIAVVNRLGVTANSLPSNFRSISIPDVDVSATLLRERYQSGGTTKYLIPDAVDTYIRANKLYLETES